MSYARVIRPETINILGHTQWPTNQYMTNQCFETQEEPTRKQTWWGKFKAKAKKAFDKFKPKAQKALDTFKEAVIFVKDNIVPIIIAVAGAFNAWSYFRHSSGNVRCTACVA